MRRNERTVWGIGCVAFLVLAGGCTARRDGADGPSIKAGDRPAAEARVIEYFRRTAVIPPASRLDVINWAAAGVPGWNKATLQIDSGFRSQSIDFVASDDGRYLIRGEIVDLTVDPRQAIRAKIDLKNQPVLGAPDAPVTIVEFSDFQCPFCGKASQTVERDLLQAYPGKVKLVHKNFPLTQVHPWAERAAIAAECALQQSNDGYWKLYESLFQQQKTTTPMNLRERVMATAGEAGLDRQAFGKCYDNQATVALVQADMAEGNALGVNSTPTFFVNGRRLSGAVPLEQFRNVIDAEIGQR